jgi:hypothetical protein
MDPQVECSSEKAENQSRKRAVIGIGLMPVLAALGLAGWVIGNSRDIPAPDLSDLTLQPRKLPAEQDAYTHFERAAAALVWPKDAAFLRLDAAPQPDDEARVRELVTANGEALRHLKSGLACEACLGLQDSRYDATVPVIRWQNLGRLLAAQTRYELRAGHRTQAVAACADSLRFSDFLTRDASCAVVWLIGTSNLALGTHWTVMIASDPETSEADLAELLRALNAITPFERGLERAFKSEYMIVGDAISRVEKGTMKIPDGGGEIPEQPRWLPLPASYLFQPNRCRLVAAESVRAAIWAIPRCVAEALPERGASGLTGEESALELYRKPNPHGRKLLGTVGADLRGLIHTKDRAEGRLSGARLVVALRLFEKRTGKLPATLAELVPAYLPAVPRDPYDGNPFRYAPEKRLVYAVGMDLKDSGGTPTPPRKPGEKRSKTNPDEVFGLDAAGQE